MPSIASFRGLRYDPAHVGAISQVIAPPAEAIDPDLQAQLYEQHPANVVRLELNREEPGDSDQNNRSTRAAKFLKSWRDQGVLMQEPAAALYVYHQLFDLEGRRHIVRGVLARVQLESFETDHSSRPERPTPAACEDRLLLTRACRANLSPVLGRYPDAAGEAQAILDAAVSSQPALEADDILNVTHRLWPLTDQTVTARVAGLIGPRPLVLTAGFACYEAASRYRDELAAAHAEANDGAELPTDHPANFVLMMLVGDDEADGQPVATTGFASPLPASGLVLNLLN